MIRISKEPERFTPPWRASADPKPVFLIRAGNVMERGMIEAELAGEHLAGRVFSFELVAAFRSGIEALLPGDDEGAALIALAEQEMALESDETLPPDEAQRLAAAREQLAQHWPDYRAIVSRQARRRELAPILAFRRFCVGWENVGAKFARGLDGLVTDDALQGVDPIDLVGAGNRAFNLLYAGDQSGNSERPSASDSGPTSSTSDTTSKAAGKSTGRSGRRTPV